MSKVVLDLDESAILRARALLDAFRRDDGQHWDDVLTSDYDTPGSAMSAYKTFCALFCFADRAIDWLEHETGYTHDELHDIFTRTFVDALGRMDDDE